MKTNLSKSLLFIVLTLLISGSYAQSGFPYPVDLFGEKYAAEKLKQINETHHNVLLKQNPDYDSERHQYEQAVQEFLKHYKPETEKSGTITIPVVFHVVYNQPIENISDSRIYSQMIVLNEDFSRSAADTVDTPAPFKSIAANPDIQFCLAQRDPNGGSTDGIERRYTTDTIFGFDNQVKSLVQGGLDAWDPTRYFNIWVCNTGGVCWGEFPTGSVSNTYGAVMHYVYVGSKYTSYGNFPNINPYYDRGEIGVHEVGHCFNLRHIWGDDGTACTGSDTCADTPNQQGPSAYCPTFPLYDSCTTSGNGIMFNNFMDYSDDDCYNILTKGQSARIHAVLGTPPYNALANSNACMPPAGIENHAPYNPISVYPNPSEGRFTVQANHPIDRITIYDIRGVKIREELPNSNTYQVNMTKVPAGVYIIRIQSAGSDVIKRVGIR